MQGLLSVHNDNAQGISALMKDVASRIRYLRLNVLDMRQQDFADAISVTRGAVGNWERGGGVKYPNVKAIAETFGVSEDWLWKGLGAPPDAAHIEQPLPMKAPGGRSNASEPRVVEFPPRRLPVYGQAVGGQDGRFILNGEKVRDVLCPPPLEDVPGAYAVYVRGESMLPRYEPGEMAFVNPHAPVRNGDYVVVQIRPELEGEVPFAFIKRYVSRSRQEGLILEQLNPPDQEERLMQFPDGDVVSVHKIVGNFMV